MLDIQLHVNSYFEYFLTLLGWIINDNIWELLVETGLFALPMLFSILRLWLKVREEGDDEGNKGKLLISRLEHALYMQVVMIAFTCMPLMTASVNNLVYDESRSQQCGYTILKPQDTNLGAMQSTLDGQVAKLPLWWAFTHTLNKAVTQAAITAIPCKPDLRQLRFDVQRTQITSPVLRQEVQEFYEQCYVPARTKIKRQQIEVDEVQARDLDWIGSRLMVETPGLYDRYRSKMPRKQWTYDPQRDQALPNTGKGGFPTCREWWDDAGIGLKARLLEQYDPSLIQRFKNWVDGNDLRGSLSESDILVRTLVRPENIKVSTGAAYSNLSYNLTPDDDLFSSARSAVSRFFSGVGTTLGLTAATPGFDAMRQALPMIQGFLIMALTISMPIILLMSAYSAKTVMTLTFVQFGLYFLTFWWELARWLDTWLLTALYNSDTHNAWNIVGVMNLEDDTVVKLVIGTMYLLLPSFFMIAIGWAGITVGNIASSFSRGSQSTQASGSQVAQRGTNIAQQTATKGMK
ncbi:conjugal transfer protein TraG N-terminal domain-containing protein [Gallibacterium salpingitidis]|uniref:conjugal transfer protein TraG N-terminal domain-containing protein n=1 Tax=Gallibacterium salpingitidis TaxID=505341 RepID=UPI00266ECEBE|nr:conjugal transfer protein TraG N-terminal domain-containing protein [Gallibacterium salpingitidis]WKS98641.1 conjugal transfer protein TraG N-terminal domain-containing protein [Gallibacterium salpingitidis]